MSTEKNYVQPLFAPNILDKSPPVLFQMPVKFVLSQKPNFFIRRKKFFIFFVLEKIVPYTRALT